MDPKIIEFISTQKISALTTMLTDGMPHAAALHYSHRNDPMELYFSTENTSRKAQALLDGKSSKAAVVIGFSEEKWIALQMEGEVVTIMDKEELSRIHSVHYKKHPGSEKYKDDPATIFLKFTPTWFRYTDYNTAPLTIITNEK